MVVNAMLEAKLELFPYLSVQGDELIVLIRCPLHVLQRFADKSDFEMRADPAQLELTLKAGNPQYRIAPIQITHDVDITPIPPTEYIYFKYEQDLNPNIYYVYPGLQDAFSKSVRLKLTFNILRAPKRMGGCDIELSKLLFKKKILCMFPMHDKEQAKQLLARCWHWGTMPWDIPTHDLKEYFGEKIALYNVFIAHYSYWCDTRMQTIPPVLPIYSVVITIWSIFMLEYWKREEFRASLR